MAKEADQELRGVAYGSVRRLMEGLPARVIMALGVFGGVLALLLVVLMRSPLRSLPEYPAVVLAFLIAFVLPGLVLQRALLTSPNVDIVVRLAVAPALGIAIAAVPGFIALTGHLSLEDFAMLHAFVAAGVCGASMLVLPRDGLPDDEMTPQDRRGLLVPAAGALIVLGAIVMVPVWAEDEVAANFDTWTYMAYVQDYITVEGLNEDEPILGTGDAVNPRMLSNVWVLSQALIVDATDVTPHDVLAEFLPPILVLFAVLATYALTRSLFGSVTVAVLAVAFVLGYAALDLAPHEGFGGNLLLRITEDKMAGSFLVFPIGLMFVARFFARPAVGDFVGAALVALALSVVHPMPLVFLAVAVVAFAAFRAAYERTLEPVASALMLLVPIALCSLWPFVQRQLLISEVPEIWDTATRFREEFHFIRLGGGLVIGNHHLFLHPLMILSLLLAPVVWLASRRSTGNQLVLAVTGGVLVAVFFPPFSTAVSEVLAPQTLWRIPWMLPVAPVLAYVTYLGVRRLRPNAGRLYDVAGPALAVVIVLGGAFVVQEQYMPLDGGAYYDWDGPDTVFPWMEDSVFLDGVDRALSGNWRLQDHEERLFDYLQTAIPRESTLLIEPRLLGHKLPGVLTEVYPVDFLAVTTDEERESDAIAFEQGDLTPGEIEDVIERWGVDYVIAREVGPANEPLESMSRLEWMASVGPYAVYEVLDTAG